MLTAYQRFMADDPYQATRVRYVLSCTSSTAPCPFLPTDAGMSDAGAQDGELIDAGSPVDAAANDATMIDAGLPVDASVPGDAGLPVDAVTPNDSGFAADAGLSSMDAGTNDAQSSDAGNAAAKQGGCSCRSGPEPAGSDPTGAALGFLALLLVAIRPLRVATCVAPSRSRRADRRSDSTASW
jgi:MYXO-CTERM domain-containing protein